MCVRARRTFPLMAQLVVVLPQLGDELRSLQLNLGVGGQVVGGGLLSDHSISLHIQVPVDPANTDQSINLIIKTKTGEVASVLTRLVCTARGRGSAWWG